MLSMQLENYEPVVRRIRLLSGGIEARKFTAKCATHQLQAMRPRINSGIDRNGNRFKAYSSEPMYISKATPGFRSRIKPVGKAGEKQFANGKKHKSQYFPRGYAEFRLAMGLSNKNRLELRSKMLNSMTVSNYGKDGSQIVFSRREENQKALGNERRYEFWGFTREEQKSNLNYARRLFNDIIAKAAK